MKIYNQNKTEIIENPNLELGYLKDDKVFVKHIEHKDEVQEQSHYITIHEYVNENGEVYGRDVEKVIDVPYQPEIIEHDEYEPVQVFIPYSEAELLDIKKNKLRSWRYKYFNVLDRATWFASLTESEKAEVIEFRQRLLDITITLEKPTIPNCVRSEVQDNE